MTANISIMRECLELILMWADALDRQRAKSLQASRVSPLYPSRRVDCARESENALDRSRLTPLSLPSRGGAYAGERAADRLHCGRGHAKSGGNLAHAVARGLAGV
jgi:hypothetical protein